MMHRVVITGLGTVSGAGSNSDEFLNALKSGQNGFIPIDDKRLSHLKSNQVALVDESVLSDAHLPSEIREIHPDNMLCLALHAGMEAVTKAGLDGPLGPRAAVVLGTCSGGMQSVEKHYRSICKGTSILDDSLLFAKRYYTPAKVLAYRMGASGPVMTVVTACAAGAGAVAEATNLIRAGIVDIALAGGADTFAPSTLLGFDALKATCEGICTPFSTNIGLNLGEGAGLLVLESAASAEKRGATVLAEVMGFGLSNDAYHPTSPDPSCKAQLAALRRTLSDAQMEVEDIDYINAHGTGTRANDAVESKTISKFLGEKAKQVPVSSTKSLIGHCLGAAGALEIAATIMSAKAGFVPPTVGYDLPRDGCQLDYVSDLNRPFNGRYAVSNSFGFGGNNACMMIDTKPDMAHTRDNMRSLGPRPVITGSGVVHALGTDFERLTSDETGLDLPARLGRSDGLAGLVPPIDFRKVDRRLDCRGMGKMAAYATVAARQALESGRIRLRPVVAAEIGVVMGLASGDTESEASHLTATFESDFNLERVESFPFVVQNAAAGQMARALMLKGHSTVLSIGWGAGLFALLSGALAIECGQSDTLLACGCDVLTSRTLEDGETVGIFSPSLIPGEGAGALLLEHPDAAEKRGATVLAEILGYCSATDASNPMTHGDTSLFRALYGALSQAGISGNEIQRVGLSMSDHPVHQMEMTCAKRILGSAVPVSLYSKIGFSEAALPMINLAHMLNNAAPNTLLAVISLSLEGAAAAAVLRRV